MPEHTPAPTPSRSVYGFVLHLFSSIIFKLYLLWAIIPESWFASLNITYLPQRYWAVAIPIYLLTILATFAFIIYPSINLCMTPAIDDVKTVKESNSRKRKISEHVKHPTKCCTDYYCSCVTQKCYVNEFMKINKDSIKYSIPVVEDLCMADVSKTLYMQ